MPSRLPIRIRPAADEIAVSYLNRLATLHEIPFPELWPQVSGPRNRATRRLDADLLAAVADQPRERLARAVIELRAPEPDWLAVRHEPQRGCWRCNAAHPGGRVLQLLGHHRYACTRHRVWIGPPDLTDHPQPDLTPLPEIVAAQHVHLRLLRRIGPAATFDAVLTGFLICAHRWKSRHDPTPTDARHHWARRAETLIPPGTETLTFSASRLFAATYPEAVSIAEMIGTLHWRRLAAGDPDAQRRFATAIGRRLGQPDYRPGIVNDPIAHWIDQDCGATGCPATTTAACAPSGATASASRIRTSTKLVSPALTGSHYTVAAATRCSTTAPSHQSSSAIGLHPSRCSKARSTPQPTSAGVRGRNSTTGMAPCPARASDPRRPHRTTWTPRPNRRPGHNEHNHGRTSTRGPGHPANDRSSSIENAIESCQAIPGTGARAARRGSQRNLPKKCKEWRVGSHQMSPCCW